MGEVTVLLHAAREGDSSAVDRVVALLYPELRRIARAKLRQRDDRLLLDTGALVHEAYLRLIKLDQLSATDRSHFLAYAARTMRSVIVDIVRERQADRRGGEHGLVTLDTAAMNGAIPQGEDTILQVHEALEELAQVDERLVRVVEMRYFVGLSNEEIAQSLGVTSRTVERDWEKARSFLFTSMKKS
jgi:RNA polymerase sigma factor (TIGR02999 family)